MENFNYITGALIPYLNFFLFVYLCVRFFKKPIVEKMSKRREDFLLKKSEAEKLYFSAKETLSKIEQRKKDLQKEVNEILDHAKKFSQSEYDRLIKEANDQGQHLLSETNKMLEAQILNLRKEFERDILEKVVAEVEKQILKNSSKELQHKIVGQGIKKIEEISEI